jgi:hypothetical protein
MKKQLNKRSQMIKYKIKCKKNNFMNSLVTIGVSFSTVLSGIAISAEQSSSLSVQPLADELLKCASIEQNEKRLSCFDQLTASLSPPSVTVDKSVLMAKAPENLEDKVAPVSTAIVAESLQPVEKTNQQKVAEFAKEQVTLSKEEQEEAAKGELTEFTATVSSLKKLVRGEWVINLDNGQKWQQVGSDRLKLKVGHLVTIRKGALGAIYLSNESSSRQIRVKRKK